MDYGELESTWTPLLNRFVRVGRSRSGMEPDDLRQELRIVLVNCWHKFDPNRGAKFGTYLYRSMLNHVLKLGERANRVRRSPPGDAHLPPWARVLSLDTAMVDEASDDHDPADVAVLKIGDEAFVAALPRYARMLADEILGERRRPLTTLQRKRGREQLRRVLVRGKKEGR